jgi:signal transduction histidine kinase
MPRLTLATRTFFLSFVPICLLLLSTFVAINTAIHERVKQDLADSLRNLDQLLNQASEDFSRENAALLLKLTDSAGLRASVSLLSEQQKDSSVAAQVRATIAQQLREFAIGSPYDYLAISDPAGKTVVAIGKKDGVVSDEQSEPMQDGLAERGGAPFQFQTVPIEIAGEMAAFLTLGRPFDLQRVTADGDATLWRNGRIAYSTFPAALTQQLEQVLSKDCFRVEGGCELRVAGRLYVVSALRRLVLGSRFQLLVFRSLDAPLRTFNRAFLPTMIEVGLGGITFALVCTVVTTRSVVRPLRRLTSQLEIGAKLGELPEKLDSGDGVKDIELVTSAFNRVADAERRSRRDLIVAKQAADVANRLKTEFLNNVSHELRTPINGVLGMTELLRSTEMNVEQAEFTATIRQSAINLVALIDQILDFSELETGKLRLKICEMDLTRILDDAATAAQAQAGKKSITVVICCPASLPPKCIGDEKRIRQALMHLCDNAVKYTESGSVRVALEYQWTESRQGELTFSVEDSGIGIEAENLRLIFEAFTQVDGTLTRRQGGTGIGLNVAKNLVELMGGRLGVRSTPGYGSTFWFTVPADLTGDHPQHTIIEVVQAV